MSECVEIDEKVERYRRLLSGVGDQVTVERFEKAIAELQADKIALHPEQEQ